MRRKSRQYSHFIIIFIMLGIFIACGMEEIQSTWCDHKTAISDAGLVKWDNAKPLAIIGGEVTVNVLNDNETLYMRLSTQNPAFVTQFLQTGFTVWFDDTGGTKKIFGMRFPLPITKGASDTSRSGNKSQKEDGKRDILTAKLLEASKGDIEIFRPGENEFSTISAEYSAPYGIRCRLENINGRFVYELQMPLILDNNHPYAVTSKKPKVIGIGLETGKGDQQTKFREARAPRRTATALENITAEQSPIVQSYQASGKSINQWLKVQLAER
ncbi:MAG: hypothetical protein PHN75_13620 [Syntrophales bacterium]|nr:hypothetical protein [Syntrophales bacterium]